MNQIVRDERNKVSASFAENSGKTPPQHHARRVENLSSRWSRRKGLIVLENRDDDGAAACLDGKREAADLMFIVREPLAFLADCMLVYDQIIIPADFNAIQRLEADVASRYFAGNLRLA